MITRLSLRLFFLLALLGHLPAFATESPPPDDPIPGIITNWELSPTGRYSDLATERYLDGKTPSSITWQSALSDASGWVDIARSSKPSMAPSKVWARTIITSKQKESRPFTLSYRDAVSVYLNGRILYRGHRDLQKQDPSLVSALGWNDTLYLPLESGENELVFMVSNPFGGWGFKVRDLKAIYLHPTLEKLWEIPGQLNAPESVAFDRDRKLLYVSNFGGDCISKVGLDGTVIALKWITEIKSPTGLKYFAGKLYVVERSGLAVIDPEQGNIIKRLAIPDASFVNDLAIADAGVIYVTDTFKNCVFKLSNGASEIWLSGNDVGEPNGILVEKDRLLVGVSADASLKTFDLKSKHAQTLVTLDAGANMDGLVSDGKGGYLFSNYYGRIYRLDASGRRTLLLDSEGPHQGTADFEYIPETGLLIVPSLYDQRLTAYRIAMP